MSTSTVEVELLARAKSGDEQAFAELAGQHRARLWSICLRVTGNEYDAEDALQEALTAAWLNLARFRGDARFGTWAYRIASNAAVAAARRRRATPTEPDQLDEPLGHDFTEQFADRDQVSTALASLGVQFREAIVLREYGEFTYEEIAAHQGVPVQTVKSRLNRARAAVLAELNRHEAG